MRYLTFVSLFAPCAKCFTWAVSFSCTAARWPSTHAVEFCEGSHCGADFLLNVARLLCLTCRGLHALPARLSLHALSSQARHWLEVHHHVLDLDDFISELHLNNLHDSCDFWKLLQHRVSSTTGHQRSLNEREMAQFSAPLHLWRLSLHHDSTLFCCGGFCQSCGKVRLDHLEPSNDSCALSSPPW